LSIEVYGFVGTSIRCGFAITSMRTAPYVAALLYNKRHKCGAALYGERVVVTAAHCFGSGEQPLSDYSVALGIAKIGNRVTAEYIYGIDRRIVHPKYNGSVEFDVAVLHLARTPELSDEVQPIQLSQQEPAAGMSCKIYGWGVPEEGRDEKHSYDLRSIASPITDTGECSMELSESVDVETMFCTGEHHSCKSACTGDSGGPAVCRANDTAPVELYGIVAFVRGGVNDTCPAVVNKTETVHTSVWAMKTFLEKARKPASRELEKREITLDDIIRVLSWLAQFF